MYTRYENTLRKTVLVLIGSARACLSPASRSFMLRSNNNK